MIVVMAVTKEKIMPVCMGYVRPWIDQWRLGPLRGLVGGEKRGRVESWQLVTLLTVTNCE